MLRKTLWRHDVPSRYVVVQIVNHHHQYIFLVTLYISSNVMLVHIQFLINHVTPRHLKLHLHDVSAICASSWQNWGHSETALFEEEWRVLGRSLLYYSISELRSRQARIQRGGGTGGTCPPLEKMGSPNLPRTNEFFRGVGWGWGWGCMVSGKRSKQRYQSYIYY